MNRTKFFSKGILLAMVCIGIGVLGTVGCNKSKNNPVSRSGLAPATADVKKGSDGLTNSQRAIKKREEMFNEEGVIQHIYFISAFSGQVILYSTVDGKVMSSTNRLMPKTINGRTGDTSYDAGFPIDVGGTRHYTSEMMRDDGTYGSSIPYLYWWDANGNYQQHYISGGQIIRISSAPLKGVRKIIISTENADGK